MGSSSKASKRHVAAVAPAGPATLAPPDEDEAPTDAVGGSPATGAAAPAIEGFADAGPANVPATAVPVEAPPKRAHIRVVQDADGTWHVEVQRDG